MKYIKLPEGQVMLYTVNGTRTDSNSVSLIPDLPYITFYPLDDYNDTAAPSKLFILAGKNRKDTLKNVNAVFRRVEIICDKRWGCGRGLGNKKTTVMKLESFTFSYKGQTFEGRDTLYLN